MADELTDLLLAGVRGDRPSLEEFVRRTQGDVWRLCRAFLSPEQADDATQEVYLRVWRSAPSFRGDSSAKTWLFTIVRRTCFEQMRKAQRYRARHRGSPEDFVVQDPARALVLQAVIDRLEPDRRAAFVLTQLHGFSYEEAAKVCDCRIGTIRSRVARARAEMVQAMQPISDAEGGS